MPSSSFDPWFASRRFAIIIDAGSSGSRLQIYSWRANYHLSQPTLPVVESGSENPVHSIIKVVPGISSFANSPTKISQHLAPLLQHARDYIPPSLHSDTPLFLYATAGMRLLPHKAQIAILDSACDFLRFHSEFRVTDGDDDDDDTHLQSNHNEPPPPRACKNHVRVISGEEEGLFGWIAVNYLMDAFSSTTPNASSYGFLDMGGASAQIAFKVDPNSTLHSALPRMPVTLNLLNGQSIHHQVFVTTWLGYGTNQARERYISTIATPSTITDDIPDPCLPRGLSIPLYDLGSRHNPIIIQNDEEEENYDKDDLQSKPTSYLRGTGSFDQCLSQSAKMISNDTNPSPNYSPLPLSFPLPLKTTPFVGVSEYWYTTEHLFGLGGAYDDTAFEEAAKKFCAVHWKDIQFLYLGLGERESEEQEQEQDEESSSFKPHSKHASKIDVHRLETQCFKSAWMMNVLHLGLGMPRSRTRPVEVERLDDHDREDIVFVGVVGEDVGPPTPPPPPMFQSVDTIRDTSISWTLGKMVLEASREVGRNRAPPPPPPHVDDHLLTPPLPSPHISPSPLSASPVLSSPFVLCLYAVALAVLFLVSCRLGVCYQAKVALRRWWRKRSRQTVFNGIVKLGIYTDDDDDSNEKKLEMGAGIESGKPFRSTSTISSVLSFFSTRFARPIRNPNSHSSRESYSMMTHVNLNHDPVLHFLPANSNSDASYGMSLSDDYHYPMNANSARVIYRSASLPVSLSSSPPQSQVQPQPQSLYPYPYPSSSTSTSYTNSPSSLSTYTSLSSVGSTTALAMANTTNTNTNANAAAAATTALTTQPLSVFAQSRSRNSSQVNLANPNSNYNPNFGGGASTQAPGFQVRISSGLSGGASSRLGMSSSSSPSPIASQTSLVSSSSLSFKRVL